MRRLAGFLLALAVAFAQGQTGYRGLVLSTPFPALTVKAGEVVNLPVALRNYGLPPQLTRLRVEGAPADWTVAFLGSGRVVEAAFLPPDATQNLTLRVEVPQGVGGRPLHDDRSRRGDKRPGPPPPHPHRRQGAAAFAAARGGAARA